MESWSRLVKLAYKWGTLPAVILALFMGHGWDALRVAQGYAETTGVVTHFSCAKSVVVRFDYTVDGIVHQGTDVSTLSSFECPPYSPGKVVNVFYSRRHPDLVLMDMTPRQALWHQLGIIFAILLLFPMVAFMIAVKET